MKSALITGFTGQDGTFLARYLLDLGYIVTGITRRISTEPPTRVRGRFDFSKELREGQLRLVSADLTDLPSLLRVFRGMHFDEVYNLAAQSDVRVSFDQPVLTFEQNAIGVLNLLACLETNANTKLYHASTSELFGTNSADNGAQDENTPFQPASPYGEAKLAAYWAVRNWRNRGNFACNGILFNHESEIRGGNFVTQKIAREVCHLLIHPEAAELQLGNLDARRDWGYAGDYIKAMHAMLQQPIADDFVIATGETHTVREFVEAALAGIDKTVDWQGEGLHEVGVVDGRVFVTINREYYRPVEVGHLHGNATKARETLHWQPEVSFEDLVYKMVNYQVESAYAKMKGNAA